MLVKVGSIANRGVDTFKVEVEVNISSRGIPGLEIVGLPGKSVAESKDRVKTAFQNSGLEFPNKKITINLAPADVTKEGSLYDLPIAVGLICAVFNLEVPERSLFFGELSFDGSLRHTRGSFLLSLYAKENKFERVFVPSQCLKEASSVSGVKVFGVQNLNSLVDHLSGIALIDFHGPENLNFSLQKRDRFFSEERFDMKYVVGQEQVKRALEICAAGGHNLIMIGPPGSGKPMVAKALISILPDLTEDESIEVTKIYSLVGKIPPNCGLLKERPFRSPHHTISYAGMIGGGNNPTPGEITLSHRGVLFMDEFSKFSRPVLESLRQPMESGKITVSRSRFSVDFPSKFMLIASSNPCPCGYYGDPKHECRCSEKRIKSYQSKLSGPILDRIDIHLNVFPVEKERLLNDKSSAEAECSSSVRDRVLKAREIQQIRYKREKIFSNNEMINRQIERYCKMDSNSKKLLVQATERFGLSTRAYFRLIKVARTIADLDNKEDIQLDHIAEAVQYRSKVFL